MSGPSVQKKILTTESSNQLNGKMKKKMYFNTHIFCLSNGSRPITPLPATENSTRAVCRL